MRLSKTFFFLGIVAAFIASFGVFNASIAHADSCDITTADFSQIAAIQDDPTLTSSQELTKELGVRKQLIAQTIVCAQGEVQSLQASLQGVSTDSTSANIQSQLSDQLNAATSFYNAELVKLNTAGIAGTENIAREILAWRQGTYASLEAQVDNFTLWSANQSLFTTAQNRMNQIQYAVSFIETASANGNLENDFNAAYSSFQIAKSQNAAAESALAHFLSPDQSLILIKQSLDSLSDTYQKFFTVSDDIKLLLPQ